MFLRRKYPSNILNLERIYEIYEPIYAHLAKRIRFGKLVVEINYKNG